MEPVVCLMRLDEVGPAEPEIPQMLRVDEGGVLVAGVAEADEPLPVDGLCHPLQQLDPPPVVLDQIIDGVEDSRDDLLLLPRRQEDRDLAELA